MFDRAEVTGFWGLMMLMNCKRKHSALSLTGSVDRNDHWHHFVRLNELRVVMEGGNAEFRKPT